MKKEKDRLSIITLAVAKSYTNKAISALSEVVRYIGVTTTEISDGSTTNPITIDGSSVMAVSGDTVFYEGSAYTFDGTKWQETISFAEVITEIETITGEIGDLTALTTLVKSSIVAAINELNEKKTNLSVIAALFDASVSYAVGDYCTKDGLFYKCTTAHTGAWDANDFQAVTVGNEIDANATDINGIKNGATINNFAGVETALANKVDKVDGKVLSTNDYTDADKTIVAGVTTALASKQDILTFDDTPTDNSNNPVKSNGIYDALATKQNATDNSLDTDAKTIVGAINEHEGDISSLKSGFTTLDTEVNGDATVYPYADVITISDAVPANLAECNVKIEPVQDLHGYDKPWVGGAGKNKLPLVLADIKAANTSGTWNGNTYTRNGCTFSFDTDPDTDNITCITVNRIEQSSNTSSMTLVSGSTLESLQLGSSIINGISGGSNDTYYFYAYKVDNGEGGVYVVNGDLSINCTPGEGANITLQIKSDYNAQNLKVYPMIRLATETDATFAPYTNICPISGHTEASVQRDGRNMWNGDVFKSGKAIDNTGAEISANNYSLFKYVLPVGNYTVSFADTDKTSEIKIARVGVFNSDDSVANVVSTNNYTSESGRLSLPFSVTDKTQYAIVSLRAVSVVDVQLELGSTATPYVPYQGKTYTIQLGDTIYGGTVDFNSGVMKVTHQITDLGDYNYTKQTVADFTVFYTDFNAVANAKYGNINYKGTSLCSSFDYASAITVTSGNAETINVGYSDSHRLRICTKVYESYTESDFKTALTGQKLCYELATPTTIQLTPQQIQLLKGTNTLTASTGQISVTVNGVSGSIGAVQEQVNAMDAALAELAADIAEQLPAAPTTDGAYVLTVTVADGTPTYSWDSAT